MNNVSYDLKVGYACNNNCIHCVVKPNYLEAVDFETNSKDKNKQPYLNFSYSKIIELLNSKEAQAASSITITGGEPTMRKDFFEIIKYITKRYSEKEINIQTNGRLLTQHVEKLYNINKNISFVIALHSGIEQNHNFIVGNKETQLENPFVETLSSIKKVLEYFPEDNLRIEVVFSKYNYKDIDSIFNIVKKYNVKHIGFSYPHLDGFYLKNKEYLIQNSISFNELKPYLKNILEFANMNEKIVISLEAIPYCMIYENNKDILPNLIFDPICINKETYIRYPNTQNNQLLNTEALYKKPLSCKKCKVFTICNGAWWEALSVFNTDIYSPLI